MVSVEGKGSKSFSEIKKLIYSNPKLAHNLLEKISNAASSYLSAKIEAGANAVQIFDTWAGILSPKDYEEFALRYVKQIIANIKRKDEPVIYFGKGIHYKLNEMAESGAAQFAPLYPAEMSLWEKIKTIATQIYRADDVVADQSVRDQLKGFEAQGYGHFPICMAKTHLSISHDPAVKGAPHDYVMTVREVRASVGAGFISPMLGEMRTMPGLGATPAFMKVDRHRESGSIRPPSLSGHMGGDGHARVFHSRSMGTIVSEVIGPEN